ncbi:uncharacterized protein LOC129585906 [Paramacrobiotus metropolitanus]|uniref:uncharacterized protein LOC129585906 n=1 Tax=Paramacrobiotus metropolitanus TaxID=2943436 RepID=UPI002445FDBA|nr:uncharacterized protein LOC129585906 [Paramacrobiotus metropolitanus]
MDVLFDTLRKYSHPGELVTAVQTVITSDSFGDPAQLIELFQHKLRLGQQCVLHGKHFLRVLLVLFQKLSEEQDGAQVSSFLRSNDWIRNFGALVVLLCWDEISSNPPEIALPTLQSILSATPFFGIPVMERILGSAQILSCQLKVVEETFRRNGRFQTLTDTEFGDLFNKAFPDLEEASVLPTILYFSTPNSVDESFLRSLPVIQHFQRRRDTSSKRVRFSTDENVTCPENPSESDINRQRDIATFSGYRILMDVMMAIFEDAARRKMSNSSKRSSRLSLQFDLSTDDTERLDSMDVENRLKNIYPLTYRVEILENLFSLLFLRSSDVNENYFLEESFIPEETDSESVKSWSSAVKKVRDGFCCCSDKLVEKILSTIKNVVITTHSHRSSETASASPAPFSVHTSVPDDELSRRLSSLEQRLNDASWRLEVIVYPKDVPLSVNLAYTDDLMRPSFLTRKLEARRSSKRRRPRKRRVSSILKKHVDTSVIEKMLSGPGSLLRICLHGGSFHLADQVLKLFTLEDADWQGEIEFGEEFHTILSSSGQKMSGKQLKSSAQLAEPHPVCPASEMTEQQRNLLIASDCAIIQLATASRGSSPNVRNVTDILNSLDGKFPRYEFLKSMRIQPYEDFVRTNMETACSLNQCLSFLIALPFNPVAMQSVAALGHEIQVRIDRLEQLLNEPPRPGGNGVPLIKQIIKILRGTVPASGLLSMLNGQAADPTVSRLAYLMAWQTFSKNYSTCLKLSTEGDNFSLMYQSPYYRLRGMLQNQSPRDEIEHFIKTLSLDLPRMLLSQSTRAKQLDSARSIVTNEGIVFLNDGCAERSVSLTDPNKFVAGILTGLLKLFRDAQESPYSPKKILLTSVSDLLNGLQALQHAKCDIVSDDERLVFYLNVYNLLFIHALLHSESLKASGFRSWQANEIVTRMHFWKYRYHLGEYGIVSLQDLYDALSPLRQPLSSQNLRLPRRKENGFLMANSENVITIQVLHADMLKAQTNMAISEYTKNNGFFDSGRNIFQLPGWMFRIYPSDQLYRLVEEHWDRDRGDIIFDQLVIEPNRRVSRERKIHRDLSAPNGKHAAFSTAKVRSSEAEDSAGNAPSLSDMEETSFPLPELLPYLSNANSRLASMLSFEPKNSILPANMSVRNAVSCLLSFHDRLHSLSIICEALWEAVRHGLDPSAIMEFPLIRLELAGSLGGKLLRNVVLAVAIEKNLATEPWTLCGQIWDVELRLRTVLQVWKSWPLGQLVDFFDMLSVEDPRSTVVGLQIRIKNLEMLVRNFAFDKVGWKEVFSNSTLEYVMTQMAFKDLESRIEHHFKIFSASVLRLDQTEALNAWLSQSEMPSLELFKEDIQIKGLVHMLDSKPPQILAAYQLLIPMLKNCTFTKMEELLASITTAEGRLPVIHIALLSGRFDEYEVGRLREREIENLILRLLPEFLRKAVLHLSGRPLLILEQLIMWNKVDYLVDVVKIAGIWDVFSQRMFEQLLVDYAKKAIQVFSSPSEHSRSGSIASGLDASGRRESTVDVNPKKFIMPIVAPMKHEWVEDDSVQNCPVCGEKFTLFNRKHHCRRCGRVVCSTCSGQTIHVDLYGDNPVRACDDCFDQTISLSSSGRSTKFHGIDFISRVRSPTATQSPARTLSPKPRERLVGLNGASDQQQWLLTTDEDNNHAVRSEFFFVEAPDAALCIALLKLHSSPLIAGKELLKMGNELSEWMGKHSDCGLEHATLLNIMRTLFFKAKIFLYEDKDSANWVHVCDNYLNQLQVVEMLLDAGAAKIPSVQELADLKTLRNVRDQLIQQERYALAIEISTKAGLDAANVWFSWGRCLLKVGKFIEAQDKLSKCLELPVDKNQINPPSAAFLEEIMEIIQEAKMPRRRGTLGADSIINLVLRGDILQPETVDPAVLENENRRRMTECLHYQEVYGTNSSLLRFYIKKGLIQKALEYSLRETVNVETFFETIIMPNLRKGHLSALEDEIIMSDPTLSKWVDYLTGVCKILMKRGMTNVLLSFQLFMKDYLRAAATCVKFFQSSSAANSYQVYFDRLHFLEDAQKHVNMYLERFASATNGEAVSKLRLSLPLEEVRKYLKTIQLQVSVTKILAGKLSRVDEKRSNGSPLPTLFGNLQAKIDVIGMLVEFHNTPKVDEYVLNIIEAQALNAEEILTKVATQAGREGLKGVLGVLLTMRKLQMLRDTQYDALVIRMIGHCDANSLTANTKEWEAFIKQISSDEQKVEALTKARKFKSAYLLAVQMQRADLVAFVGTEAGTNGDMSVQNICSRWLDSNKKRKP